MTDSQQLLADYSRTGSDAAFRELVSRYVNLVYSTAARLVSGDTHRAQDVAQTVFIDLAKLARTLPPDVMLGGWLHRHTCLVAVRTMRGERRRQSRERQAVEMNALQNDSGADFSELAPMLDEAINELEDVDRTAVLLRFFEERDFRSVGAMLGSNEDAARMRVNRALEKLENLLKRRGVKTSAAALAVVLGANAVQSAPVALAATISIAAATAATVTATTTTAAVAKTIAMTTLQKTIIGATLAAAVGTGVYEAQQASTFRTQVQTLQQQQSPLTEQVQQLQQERDDATNKLARLQTEVERLDRNNAELLKLRAEVTRLRSASPDLAGRKVGTPAPAPAASTTGDVSQMTQEAMQLWQAGRLPEAISKFEAALQLDPNNPTGWNGLGWAYFNSGKPADGEKAFQKVIELEPDHPAALNGLGQIYLSQKKYTDAETYLLKASPKAPAAWYGLARAYLLQDKFEDAEKWAQTIVDSGQGDEASRAMLKAAKDRKVSDGLRLMIEPR